jgi:hypothetical protein
VRSVLTYWLRTGVRVTDESIATIPEALSGVLEPDADPTFASACFEASRLPELCCLFPVV